MYRCVCGLYLCCKHVCTSFTHTHTQPHNSIRHEYLSQSSFLCSPLPLRNGSGALMRTLGCVSLCNTRSWTMAKEEEPKKRDEQSILCAVANFHTAFFAVCFYASLLWTFALISLNNSNIDNWQSNSLEKQQQRESLWTLEAFELKLSLWKTYCYCCNKSPAPRRYCAPPTHLNGTPTRKVQGRAGQNPARYYDAGGPTTSGLG